MAERKTEGSDTLAAAAGETSGSEAEGIGADAEEDTLTGGASAPCAQA